MVYHAKFRMKKKKQGCIIPLPLSNPDRRYDRPQAYIIQLIQLTQRCYLKVCFYSALIQCLPVRPGFDSRTIKTLFHQIKKNFALSWIRTQNIREKRLSWLSSSRHDKNRILTLNQRPHTKICYKLQIF